MAFRQVFVSRERRGAAAESDAAAILARLRAGAPGAAINTLGDPTMLPPEIDLTSASDIDRLFGPGFARRIETLAPGAWAGPVKSGYGLHLVLVRERVEGSLPKLAAVRPLVERELLAERRKRQLDAIYERLLEKYKVVIEPRAPAAAASGTPGGGS